MKDWINIEYSNKHVTAHGGMSLLKRFLDRTGISNYISSYGLPESGSNAGYSSVEILEAFWISIWLGANRFSHTSVLQHDKVLQKIFGFKRAPSNDTYRRFFQKFNLELSSNFFNDLFGWMFSHLQLDYFTLDVDSSVWTRYGKQQGARKGYNAKKRGRPSHHPLIAFVSELKMVANFWLRPGNCSSANNIINFLEETFANLAGKTVGLFRADSGFYQKNVMEWLESKTIDYVIAIKMYPVLKDAIKDKVKWIEHADGIWIGELIYKGVDWTEERRVVVIKQHIEKRPEAPGKLLFPDDEVYRNFRYSAYVTNMKLSSELIWELYRKRGDAENRIKELEYDFGADNFCMQDFYATEAALRSVMIAYNLMAIFKLTVLQSKVNERLTTVRLKCFSIGSWIVKSGRNEVLKMSVAMKNRVWMDGLFLNSSNFTWDKVKVY
jgi:hypothetical protein